MYYKVCCCFVVQSQKDTHCYCTICTKTLTQPREGKKDICEGNLETKRQTVHIYTKTVI